MKLIIVHPEQINQAAAPMPSFAPPEPPPAHQWHPEHQAAPALPPIQYDRRVYEHYVRLPDGRLVAVLPPGVQPLVMPEQHPAQHPAQSGQIITGHLVGGQTPAFGHPVQERPTARLLLPAPAPTRKHHPVTLILFGMLMAAVLAALLPWVFGDMPGQPAEAASEAEAEAVSFAPIGAIEGPASISAQKINDILASYGSPAKGSGEVWIQLGDEYGIDAAYAVAFFIHESSAGTNPGWAGIKPGGATTHNVGNIICAGYPTCYGRFRDYPSWEAGIRDWYRLIRDEYIRGRGTTTVEAIIPIYAPAFENDVQGYIDTVNNLVKKWRGAQPQPQPQAAGLVSTDCPDPLRPCGDPLQSDRTVMTQGYGVGSHAPAHIWGAIDLAIAGGPGATLGHPIYATHAGTIRVTPNSWPAGNHVWITNDQYRTGYAHLQDFTVQSGQTVVRGDKIGTVGSTGMSSGPHLDYQVWQMQHGQWVNQNPLDGFITLPGR